MNRIAMIIRRMNTESINKNICTCGREDRLNSIRESVIGGTIVIFASGVTYFLFVK